VFGAGAQIEAHVDLHLRHFPSILRCTIVNRTVSGSRVAALLSSLRTRFHNVEFTLVPLEDKNTVGQWVGQADIICTATSATTPLFETATMKKAGRVHVNLVGSYTPSMRECDDELLRTAKRVVVDSREACAKEAGEIIGSGIGVERIVEIGELVTFIQGAEAVKGTGHVGLEGDILGVQDKLALVKSGNVTVFKTVGIGSQDVAITKAVVERAEELNLGLKVEGYDLG
jgi:ornithine cyclodeaminase/alanine dehydrogenase-like protein (mu-crystallin family)